MDRSAPKLPAPVRLRVQLASARQAAATHELKVAFRLDPGELTASKRLTERVLTVHLDAQLIDLRTGQPVVLVDRKGKEWTTYTMWKRRTLRARARKGEVAVGLSQEDSGTQLEKLAFETVVELLRRVGIMTGSGE